MDFKINLSYTVNSVKYKTCVTDSNIEIISDNSGMLVKIIPHKPIDNIKFNVVFDYKFHDKSLFFSNGFQSWSYTKEYSRKEKYELPHRSLKGLLKKIGATPIGDYAFNDIRNEKGVFPSSNLCYIRELRSNKIDLFASLDESKGYTTFVANYSKNILTVHKDYEGLSLNREMTLLNLINITDNYDEAFNAYFTAIDVKPLSTTPLKGYTSWYNYYRNINDKIIDKDLNSLTSLNSNMNLFQIDDGYQRAIGDITDINPVKFPFGLKVIADKIHDNNLQAGLWSCPFGVTKKSQTYKQHKDWIVKNQHGKPTKVGLAWGGFYSLDFYNDDVRNYIKSGLATMTNDWGFDLLKLDFLYCVAHQPRNGKTRAMIMHEAMDFLRECVGDKKILACGVPIAACYNRADYVRIGADVTPNWSMFIENITREMLSTRKSMVNSIYRRFYNNRAFINDPDVFYLRDNIMFGKSKRQLLFTINKLTSNVLLTSDAVSEYSELTENIFNKIMNDDILKIDAVDRISRNVIRIDYTENGKHKLLVFNYQKGETYRNK